MIGRRLCARSVWNTQEDCEDESDGQAQTKALDRCRDIGSPFSRKPPNIMRAHRAGASKEDWRDFDRVSECRRMGNGTVVLACNGSVNVRRAGGGDPLG
jgi:hypothetical protein